LVLALLGLVSRDGAFDVFCLCFQSLVGGLEYCFVRVDEIDLVVESHIISIKHIYLIGDISEVVVMLQNAKREQHLVFLCISELFL